MPDLDTVCFLVSRLTPPQRSLLARLPSHWSEDYHHVELMEVGLAQGLRRSGLLAIDPYTGEFYQRTALGESVMEVLLDTEAIADVG